MFRECCGEAGATPKLNPGGADDLFWEMFVSLLRGDASETLSNGNDGSASAETRSLGSRSSEADGRSPLADMTAPTVRMFRAEREEDELRGEGASDAKEDEEVNRGDVGLKTEDIARVLALSTRENMPSCQVHV